MKISSKHKHINKSQLKQTDKNMVQITILKQMSLNKEYHPNIKKLCNKLTE